MMKGREGNFPPFFYTQTMADNHQQYFEKLDFVALFTAIRQKNLHAPVEWIIDQYNDHQNSLIDNSAKDEIPPKKQPKK